MEKVGDVDYGMCNVLPFIYMYLVLAVSTSTQGNPRL